jgi:hypothetical protein
MLPQRRSKIGSPLTIAVSFRWSAGVCPETTSAWTYFQNHIAELARDDWKVIGHGHPRVLQRMESWYESLGIEVVPDFYEVCRRADIYVGDNSSTIYEFAATGRNVVLLDSPEYDDNIEHGLRFWSAAMVGPHVRPDGDLPAAIAQAREGWDWNREGALYKVYSHLHGASAAAAAALEDWAA